MRLEQEIEQVVGPTIAGLGYEFVGLEYVPQSNRALLRIYADSPSGFSTQDCEKVSRALGAVLDVEEDLIKGGYTLEVSSPGVNRKLFTMEQYKPFVGQQIHLELHAPEEGRRKFTGKLESVEDGLITVSVDGQFFEFDFGKINKANVVANLKW